MGRYIIGWAEPWETEAQSRLRYAACVQSCELCTQAARKQRTVELLLQSDCIYRTHFITSNTIVNHMLNAFVTAFASFGTCCLSRNQVWKTMKRRVIVTRGAHLGKFLPIRGALSRVPAFRTLVNFFAQQAWMERVSESAFRRLPHCSYFCGDHFWGVGEKKMAVSRFWVVLIASLLIA